MDKRYQVFVSSTYKDLIPHRQLVMKALLQANGIPAGMELFPASDDTAWDLIKSVIDTSDYYVVIVGGRYGSIDPTTQKSYTEMEYEYALSKGIPALALIHREPEKIPREHTETGDAWEKLNAFRQRLTGEKHCKFWINDTELVLEVFAAFTHAVKAYPMEGWIRGGEAKTVEDVEERLRLEQQLQRVTAELQSLRSSDEALYAEFADGPEHHCVRCRTSGLPEEFLFTWDELLKICGKAALANPDQEGIKCSLANHIAQRCQWQGVPKVDDDDFVAIVNQFVALNYISVEHVFKQASDPTMRVGTITMLSFESRPGFIASWRLTERGRRKLATLLAIRKVCI